MARIMRCRLPPQVSRQPATMTARLTKRTATRCLNCIACVAPPLVPMVQAFSAQVPTMPMYGPHETLPEVVLDGLLRPPKSYYA